MDTGTRYAYRSASHSISEVRGYLTVMWYIITTNLGDIECNGERMVLLLSVTNSYDSGTSLRDSGAGPSAAAHHWCPQVTSTHLNDRSRSVQSYPA